LFFVSENSSTVFTRVHPASLIPGTKISSLHQLPKPGNKKAETHHVLVKSISKRVTDVNRRPLMVASGNINILPATPAEDRPSFTETHAPGTNLASTTDGGGGLDEAVVTTTKTNFPGEDKLTPGNVAEIMPQYPGGIGTLLSFPKKYIHAPKSAEGEDVTVKIEFMVNYDGSLENFTVVQSGGEIFDNEVLRVLKKMPLWIPGQSKGKKVAVYYTVPVKFSNEF
jgi:TonB family protein